MARDISWAASGVVLTGVESRLYTNDFARVWDDRSDDTADPSEQSRQGRV